MPDTTCAATRDGSSDTFFAFWISAKPNADTTITSAAPTATSMCVRNPAAHDRRSRSMPTMLPSNAASNRRDTISS